MIATYKAIWSLSRILLEDQQAIYSLVSHELANWLQS